MTMLTRTHAGPLELRDDGRTLVGVAVPYGVETRIGRYVESFAPGAFASAGTHTLTAAHPRDGAELPIGHSVELRDQPDGLHGAWHVSDTDTGNEMLTLVRDGVPLGLSIGFIPDREPGTATAPASSGSPPFSTTSPWSGCPRTPTPRSPHCGPHSRRQRRCCTWPGSGHCDEQPPAWLPRLREEDHQRLPVWCLPSPGQLRPRPASRQDSTARVRRALAAAVPCCDQAQPVVYRLRHLGQRRQPTDR
jgi:hypothetical protein